MRRLRIVKPVLPSETGVCRGLVYSLWLPADPIGGVVVLHGAGSCKENQYDFARACLPLGLAAILFDQRGHGESESPMDDRTLDDVVATADRLREALGDRQRPIALRGSSMGGCLAILAAAPVRAAAVVAICPASTEGMRRLLRREERPFEADIEGLDRFFAAHDLHETVAALEVPLLLMHAEGDERVPVEHSRELAERMRNPRSRLIAVPGGHHVSVQRDPELQAVSLRFIVQTLSASG